MRKFLLMFIFLFFTNTLFSQINNFTKSEKCKNYIDNNPDKTIVYMLNSKLKEAKCVSVKDFKNMLQGYENWQSFSNNLSQLENATDTSEHIELDIVYRSKGEIISKETIKIDKDFLRTTKDKRWANVWKTATGILSIYAIIATLIIFL